MQKSTEHYTNGTIQIRQRKAEQKMTASTEHKLYQKMLKKGKGSILKAIRIDKGAGKGLIAGGFILLGAAVLLSFFGGLIIFGIPALILFAIGICLSRKREASWISYYQEASGFSESEVLQLDRELASPNITLVICKSPGAAMDNFIACFFTEHYMVVNGVYPYVRRLEDFIAAAFSDSTDIWSMSSLTTQDKETKPVLLFTDTSKKAALCAEMIQELRRRNPNVLCGQMIACEGRRYILERDGAEILRLYHEGRRLEPAG